MPENEKNDLQSVEKQPKKRFFNVEKRFGYTMHEIYVHRISYFLMTPFMIFFILFIVVPTLASVVLSFTYYNILQPPRFIGWLNYKSLLVDDQLFIVALKNTLYFAIVTGPVGYVLSYFFAWLIHQVPKKIRVVYTTAFYIPSLTSGIAMSVVWLVIFANDRYGWLNSTLIRLGLITDPIQFLSNVKTIMGVIIFISLWQSLGTGFLSFVAGFDNVNTELYDAGAVDGITSKFQRLIYIDIPQTMPQLLFSAILQVTASFRVGDISQAVAGFPSPGDAGLTIVLHLRDYAITRYEMGYASAIAVILFIMIFGLGRVCFRVFGSKEG
ncbi:MAG: sugar ABC transporter permease [Clostridiales bacterium]|jgi:multiple sugar transport system permease protein|nr:sugar ABC transporter permease [Clostridiales bacterium]